MPGSIRELWPQVFNAFQDVDHILHAGDLHTLDVVDELGRLAPTLVSRGNGDRGIEDSRIEDTWRLEVGGARLAMVHQFPTPANKSAEVIEAKLERMFDRDRPHVLVYGHTHMESIDVVGNVLLVNPGSPTLPQNQSTRMGTIAILEIHAGTVEASLYQITGDGLIPHPHIGTVIHLC